jgi:hypothetical protein
MVILFPFFKFWSIYILILNMYILFATYGCIGASSFIIQYDILWYLTGLFKLFTCDRYHFYVKFVVLNFIMYRFCSLRFPAHIFKYKRLYFYALYFLSRFISYNLFSYFRYSFRVYSLVHSFNFWQVFICVIIPFHTQYKNLKIIYFFLYSHSS